MRPSKYHRLSCPRGTILLAIAAATAGCGPRCDRAWYADRDGDGFGDRTDPVEACERPDAYVADANDCDDAEASTNPDAIEQCNGVDDDCDGVIDGRSGTWYRDLDEDGIGDAERPIDACGAPDGYVALPGDCDDNDPSVYPGATVELCDGKDQDCDGIVDEGAPATVVYYPDQDFDSWGDAARGRAYCEPPAGWIARGGDCDDSSFAVSPDQLEVCNGIDDDCDGSPDEWDLGGVLGTTTVSRDADYDGYGEITAFTIEMCFVSSGYSPYRTDCDDTDASVSPAGGEVCGGGDEDCDGLIDDADPSLDPATRIVGWADGDGDGFGDPDGAVEACVYGAGVVGNDDDCDDLVADVGPDFWLVDLDGDGGGAGTPEEGQGCVPPTSGMVNAAGPVDCDDGDPEVREGLPDPCGDGIDQDCSGVDPACGVRLEGILDLEAIARGVVTGSSASETYEVVAAGRDLDGDGLGDAVVASPSSLADLLVLSGPGPDVPGPWSPSRRIPSPALGFGAALALADDADGDGVAELSVGSPDEGDGKVHIFLSGGDTMIQSGFSGARFGASLAAAGEVDGEAPPELVIGAPGDREVFLLTLGAVNPTTSLLRLQAATPTGLGEAVACCADLDGDGVDELVAGAPLDDVGGVDAGMVYAVSTREVGIYAPDVVAVAAWFGAPVVTPIGRVLATGGDFDGDGSADVAIGSPEEGATGAAFVLTSAPGVPQRVDTVAAYAVRGADPVELGAAVALSDLDGDGVADLVLGGPQSDLGGVDSGAVFVFYGPAAGVIDTDDADGVTFGAPGSRAGEALAVGPVDADPTPELWIAQPGVPGGGAWLVPGP